MTEAPNAPMNRADIVTVKVYADLFGLHLKSVYRRIAQGRQPGLLACGGQWRIDLAALRQIGPPTARVENC